MPEVVDLAEQRSPECACINIYVHVDGMGVCTYLNIFCQNTSNTQPLGYFTY